ncbi:ribonuclease HIII [Mycoplasmoides pirum]|uniref:ribonuclease HIII n=1 Tax=Mycoplasmoides pirum TaxID=2122 RepID=UPI00048958FA|nr:ribonuclease HIII [Mycoplasmoides pirum]
MHNSNKNITKKITNKEIENIVKKYKSKKINDKNQNVFFAFTLNNTRVTIYKSNKILFQGIDSEDVFNIVFNNKKHIDTSERIFQKKLLDNQIGSDEVGVGDYFGGISVAAVLVNKEDIQKLKTLKIKDSKKLNDLEIQKIAKQIEKIKIKSVFNVLNPLEYNKLFEKYKNAHIIKTYLHNKTISELIQKYTIDLKNCSIIMDQFANRKNYENYINVINPKNKIKIDIFETKGESKYISIATASILARNAWLNSIANLEKKLGLKIYLGSSNSKILNVAEFIYKKYGLDQLKTYVKLHFSFTNKIINK